MDENIINRSGLRTEDEIIDSWAIKDLTVSIVCIVFNQERYIEETIKSFLLQRTTFAIEIIIHDDVSSDASVAIIEKYKSLYPRLIKPIIASENQFSQYMCKPIVNCLKVAKSPYIALCEGDDYWVDNSKLQKQAEILSNNKYISLVHTNSYDFNVTKDKKETSNIPSKINTTMSLMTRNRIRTLTTMFRSSDYLRFSSENEVEVKKWLLGDWPLWIYLSTIGDIYLLNDTTSVYRVLDESLSHSKDLNKLNLFRQSTFEMRVYLIHKLKLSKKATQVVSNASIKNYIRFNTPLIEQAYKNCSFKYKLKYIIKRVSS